MSVAFMHSQDPCNDAEYVNPLSLDALLLDHPESTFFVEAGEGVGSDGVVHGITTGDILTIDRSLAPRLGHVVLVVHEGELKVGRFTEHEGKRYVVGSDGTAAVLDVSMGTGEVYVWGVVTAITKRLYRSSV